MILTDVLLAVYATGLLLVILAALELAETWLLRYRMTRKLRRYYEGVRKAEAKFSAPQTTPPMDGRGQQEGPDA